MHWALINGLRPWTIERSISPISYPQVFQVDWRSVDSMADFWNTQRQTGSQSNVPWAKQQFISIARDRFLSKL
jgi:hypothetical protein